MKNEERRMKNEEVRWVPTRRTSAFIVLRFSFFVLHFGVALFSPRLLAAQDPPKVTGVVKNVNLEIGTITVRPKGTMVDETFNLLKKDLEVTAPEGRKVKLDAVKPGQTVQLKPGVTGDIEAVVIQASVFLATVAEVDLKNRTIGIVDQQIKLATMAVDPAAKILLADRPAYLREIKVGSQMSVTPSLDGKTALALKLVSDPDGKLAAKLFPRVKTSRLPGTRWVGVLTDIDPAKHELRLTGPKTKGVPKAMPVAKNAVIKALHGQVAVQDLSLTELVKQAHATVLVSSENQEVIHLLVTSPVVQGKVKALDADRGRLTAEVAGNDKTFDLPRDVKVMDKTRVRRLADLQANLVVSLVLSLDRQQLLAIDIHQAALQP